MTPDQRAKRLHYHLYESLEGITEHAERIVKLEELVADMWPFAKEGIAVACMAPDCPFHERCKTSAVCLAHDGFFDRMQELGIEP